MMEMLLNVYHDDSMGRLQFNIKLFEMGNRWWFYSNGKSYRKISSVYIVLSSRIDVSYLQRQCSLLFKEMLPEIEFFFIVVVVVDYTDVCIKKKVSF